MIHTFKVSIIIPLYNREKFITRAVESCIYLPQTGEIIIVDDGSTDKSLNIALELARKYPIVKVLQHPDKKNHGRSAARNLGIKTAKFEYISFLDSDDWYLPNRFDSEETIFTQNPDVEGVYGITSSEFENSEAENKFLERYESGISKIDDDTIPEELYKTYLFSNRGRYTTDAIVLKKTVFDKVGYFPINMSFCEDTHLWCRIAAKCKLLSNNNPTPIATRYVHFENTILNNDDIFKQSFETLYKSLFIWALNQKDFSYDKKNDFFIGYKKMYPNETDFKLLSRTIWHNPSTILHTFTIHKVFQIIKAKIHFH
ncbi:MAG: glycosyltransferase family 2 protein [Alphaproteobacteria bacterium]|nr:glycosyltransferase family 2 protein [Alphaproteobacteria bacterium]